MDLKEKFKLEFEKTTEWIVKEYPNKEECARNIVGEIIIDKLHEIRYTSENLNFIEFYKKYLAGSLYLDCDDFTKSQIQEIIKESHLTERDRKLAEYYWLDLLSEEEISNRLQIDRKTVRNKIPKISLKLKETSSKLYINEK